MRIDLTGRTAVVTGAAQGIGRAIAHALAQAGAKVWVADRDAEGLAETAGAGPFPARVLDLAERGAVHAFIDEVARTDGRIDILVNGAGGVRGQVGRPVEEISEHDWRVLFDANLDSAFWCCQAVAPHMKAAGYGRIVNISSGAGLRVSLTGIQAYAAAKHAVVGLTKQLSFELGRYGITVNSVAPGLVLSNPATLRQWESYGPEGQARIIESIHTRRLGEPEDIANATLFLASNQAGWISGEILSVNGGRS
ncbi:MAG: SDR family oxidoreductase [Pseudomonadota bacterium]|nr:SDR family oxidoreductase [Pseudomonadota bacterium]